MVAGLDPVLAFELRSKDLIRPFQKWIHSLMGNNPESASVIAAFLKNTFDKTIEPALDGSIVKLARKRSLFRWYEIRKLLKQKDDLTSKMKQLLEPLKAIIAVQAKAANSASQPTVPPK
jgi:hypothetical protein